MKLYQIEEKALCDFWYLDLIKIEDAFAFRKAFNDLILFGNCVFDISSYEVKESS